MAAHASNLTLAVALAAGIVGQAVARRLRIPGIVVLLSLGAALGPEGLGWVEPRALGSGLYAIVDFGVAIILFEGGLNLEWSRLRRQESSIRRLITVGALTTLAGAAVCAHVLLGWSWSHSALFGSLVVVTGPTVVTPLLRELRLQPRLKTVLEAEGVLIDPIGAFLAVLVLQIVTVPGATFVTELGNVALRIGFGAGMGIGAGLVIGRLLHWHSVIPTGFENIFALGMVVLLFHVSDSVISQSGLLAVTLAGAVVGNLKTRIDRDLREFKDQLTVMLVGLLFVLLAADVELADIERLGPAGLAVVASLVLLVRPAAAWVSTLGSALSARERIFVAWIAPRGVVAAAIASLTAATMEAQGMGGGAELRALVFLTIAITVLLAGATARMLASLLGVRLPSRDRVAILGAQGLGLALASELKAADVPVVLFDADPKRCSAAEKAGFTVVFGDALLERTLTRAQVDLAGTAIGATFNDHLNGLFVAQAHEAFEVPHCYVSVDSLPGGKLPEHLARIGAHVLFDGPHDQERWDVRLRHDQTRTETFAWQASPAIGNANGIVAKETGTQSAESRARAESKDTYVILALRRGGRLMPMTMSLNPKKGDVARILIYVSERSAVLEALASRGWQPRTAADSSAEGPPPQPVTPNAAGSDEPQ